jgi:hypothetical protein
VCVLEQVTIVSEPDQATTKPRVQPIYFVEDQLLGRRDNLGGDAGGVTRPEAE